MADDTLPPPLGWAILDKHGIVTEWRVRLRAFFGGVLENAAPDSDHIARRDWESPGIAPHRVVAVYHEDTADTVRRLLSERDAEIDRLRKLMDDEITAGHVAASITRQIEAGMRSKIAERDERIRVLTEALRECVKSQEWYRKELDRLDAESGDDGPPNEQDEAEINARKLLENRND